jgi:hypothetical protein
MPRIPVRIGQENRIKVITAFGAPDLPYLAVNATNVVGGIVTTTELIVDGSAEFLGITTFSGDLYAQGDFQVDGTSRFVGNAIFYGGVLGLGNTTTDNIVFTGEVNSNIIPNLDNTYDLGSSSQRWRTLHVENIALTGITTVQAGVGNTYGIAYFGPNAEIVATATPSVGIQTTNLLLTTNENNIPVWTDSIDGGFY